MKVTYEGEVTEVRKLAGALGYCFAIRFLPPHNNLQYVEFRLPLLNPKSVEIGQRVTITVDTEPIVNAIDHKVEELSRMVDRHQQ